MSLEVIMCEIQNEHVFIFFIMTLFVIMWNDGWMVIYILACHHGGEKFNSLLLHFIHALKPTSDMCLGVNKLVKATLNVKNLFLFHYFG
jgi:hypothetical protein